MSEDWIKVSKENAAKECLAFAERIRKGGCRGIDPEVIAMTIRGLVLDKARLEGLDLSGPIVTR